MSLMSLLNWAEKKNFLSVRSIALYTCLAMTWIATKQAWLFASTSHFDGVGTAAVIAAVTAPLAALNGMVFAGYSASRT